MVRGIVPPVLPEMHLCLSLTMQRGINLDMAFIITMEMRLGNGLLLIIPSEEGS